MQIKPDSGHDPRILRGTFKGFVHRALNVCSEKFVEEELNFLVEVFVANGYEKTELLNLVKEVKNKKTRPQEAKQYEKDNM